MTQVRYSVYDSGDDLANCANGESEGVRLSLFQGGDRRIGELDKLSDDLRKKLRLDRKSTRLNSSHIQKSRMPSSA